RHVQYLVPVGGLSSGRGCGPRLDLLEADLSVLGVDADRVAVGEVPLEQAQRERVLDQTLDRALERPRAVRRIPAGISQRLLSSTAQFELDPSLGEPLAQPAELQLDDLRDLLLRQRLELDHLVDAVEELRPE